jgi:hypothetical protein
MVRTQISLTEEQKRLLDARSEETGVSLAELVRRAVDRCYAGGRAVEADVHAIEEAAGAWAERDFDGAEFVERVRSGARPQRR